MLEYEVVAYPYAVQYGAINIPDTVKPEDVKNYIEGNWGDIKFEEQTNLDYAGIDFEVTFVKEIRK
jgi:hypothetical protein